MTTSAPKAAPRRSNTRAFQIARGEDDRQGQPRLDQVQWVLGMSDSRPAELFAAA